MLNVYRDIALPSVVIPEAVEVFMVVVFPVRVHLLVVSGVVLRLVGVLVSWSQFVLVYFFEFHFDSAGVFVAH